MRAIWKYQLALTTGAQRVEMPLYAVVREFNMQAGYPCLWVEVDQPYQPREAREFMIIGTGHTIPDRGVYIGTCHQIVGPVPYVWHLYEVTAGRD